MTYQQLQHHAAALARLHNESLDPFAERKRPVLLPPRWSDVYRKHFATHVRDGRVR